MNKNYIGSDEHWIDSVNERYDEKERRNTEQIDDREQPDERVQCMITYQECEHYDIHAVSCLSCPIKIEDDDIRHYMAQGYSKSSIKRARKAVADEEELEDILNRQRLLNII